MINYLQECYKLTPIGMLPDIINHNNDAIRSEFNYIFDSSLNRLTKSVYAPTGSVKAHFGEFVNLACEYITIKNVDSLKNSIQLAVDEIIADNLDSHNVLDDRYSVDAEEDFKNTRFCHDTEAIGYTPTQSLQEKIQMIDASIKESTNAVNDVKEELLNKLDEVVNNLDTSIKENVTKIFENNENIQENLNNILNNSQEITDLVNHDNAIDASINDIYSKIENISTNNTASGNVENFSFTYNNKTYTQQEIAELIDMKDRLDAMLLWFENVKDTNPITITGEDNTDTTYNFVYEKE